MELQDYIIAKKAQIELKCMHDLILYKIFVPRHEISNNLVCATSKGSDQPA